MIPLSSPVCCLAQWGQAFCSGLPYRKDPPGHYWDLWEWAACSVVCLPGLSAKFPPHSLEVQQRDKELRVLHTVTQIPLLSLTDHSTLPPLTLQDSVSALKWDPTGHLLLCLGRSEVTKILGRSGGTWVTLHSLVHSSIVNIAEWCPLAGRAPEPRLMIAVWVSEYSHFFKFFFDNF